MSSLRKLCKHYALVHSKTSIYTDSIRNPVRTGIVALTRIIFFTINVMRQMFMRQILADSISKFQKITRQMLCDKCSKNDVTLMLCDKYLLTPSQNSKRSRDKCYATNVPKMTSHLSQGNHKLISIPLYGGLYLLLEG